MAEKILITGTNRGIGLEFVKQYLHLGHDVIACCRNLENAKILNALKEVFPDNLRIEKLDVTDSLDIENLTHSLQGTPIDILIHNAGIYGPHGVHFENVEVQPWIDVLKVNTIAPLILTQALYPNLKKGQRKIIIGISSHMGSITEDHYGKCYLYRSSKAALNMVVKSLSIDLLEEGFITIALHPGWVKTDMGGPDAEISTKESVDGMINVINSLTLDRAGCFITYRNEELPW